MNALTLAKLEAQLNLQIAKLEVERCVARIDHLNASDTAEVPAAKAEVPVEDRGTAANMAKKAKAEKKETAKEKTAKAAAKAEADIEAVKAAAEKATAKDLGVDTTDTTDVLGYKEGTYNVLGNFANLAHLTTEERKPYIIGMVPNIDHAKAMKEGVTHLELVNEVIDNLEGEATSKPATLPTSAGVKAIADTIGEDLLQHMADRLGVNGMVDHAKKIYAAVKAEA